MKWGGGYLGWVKQKITDCLGHCVTLIMYCILSLFEGVELLMEFGLLRWVTLAHEC